MAIKKEPRKSNLSVNRFLLHKYDRPGPRYTSYPTVPEWSEKFGPDDYIRALREASRCDEPLSLYVHIPFCRARCFYCGCNSCVVRNETRVEEYLARIEQELKLVRTYLDRRNRLSQMHWGGGTPTFLNIKQLSRLFNVVKDVFCFDSQAELAIELDPRVTSGEQLTLLAGLGFNRVSLGVQDFTEKVQRAIGRNQTWEQTEKVFLACRQLGFTGINIDLIYGLPYQSTADFSRTVERVIGLGADRVAVYSYAHLPQMKLNQLKIDATALPGTELKYDLFATAVELFLQAGYVQIGMDHFARPGDDLARALAKGALHRNFMGYTPKVTSDMLSLGMSAISNINGCFAQNTSQLDGYMKVIASGRPAVYRGWRLSRDDKIRQWVILSLMCNFVLDFKKLSERFAVDYYDYFPEENNDLEEFINDGLLERKEHRLLVKPEGRIFVRNIAMVFDIYLRKKQPGQKPLFSRTI
ncbi:MAG: oxygen-independent coproporphyrinogen III oxidase [candidate division Zixibacteria bacterium]|nr:oxygen-independent coproporphyrinogen III oxidase [candidate division Zixibacteria bacterium]